MDFRYRIKLGGVIVLISCVATIVLMFFQKRVNLFGFVDMAFFVGLTGVVIGFAIKGVRIFGREPKNIYKRFIPEDARMTESEKIEHKTQDVVVGWTFILCGVLWAGIGGLSYVIWGV